MRSRRGLAGVASAVILIATAGVGCGEEPRSAVEAVPELADILERIDEELAANRPVRARRMVEQLISATNDARDDGDLDREAADQVLVAAARLLAQLPEASTPAPAEVEPEPLPEADEPRDGPRKKPKGHDKQDKKPPKHDRDDKHDKHDEEGDEEGDDD